jgi:hypothetical protein
MISKEFIMTQKTDYTDKEWRLLVFAPSCAANEIAESDGGISKSETIAITSYMLTAKNSYKKNELINAIIDDLPEQFKNQQIPGELRYINTIEEAELVFQKIAHLVDTKAPKKEAKEYKEFILGIMKKVANASGKFLNLIGDNVSDSESEFQERIKTSLGL